MRFLKSDTDLRLLLLMLFILSVFIGSSIYYQTSVNRMRADYNEKVEHLKAIEEKLLLKEKKLNEISELKEALEKDKEVLEVGYLSLQDENEELQTEKEDLTEDSESIPFSKAMCKITGNVQCVD